MRERQGGVRFLDLSHPRARIGAPTLSGLPDLGDPRMGRTGTPVTCGVPGVQS